MEPRRRPVWPERLMALPGHRRAPRHSAALLLVLVLGLAGCSGDALGGAAARVLSGSGLEIAVDDGWAPAAVGEQVADGARVRTGGDEVRLELRAGEVWLARDSAAMVTRDRIDVIRGDVLVAAGPSLHTRWGDVEIVGASVYRLTAGLTPVVRVYDGEAEVNRPAERRALPALRQLGVSSVRLPPRNAPIAYDDDDAWDRLLLPGALAFDGEIERIARGIDRQHGAAPRDADFYETFAAVDAATIPLLAATSRIRVGTGRFGPPSDALVTLFVAEAVAAQHGGDVTEAGMSIADRRSEGSRWGLIALEEQISTVELSRVVDLAGERRTAAVPFEPALSEAAVAAISARTPSTADEAAPRGSVVGERGTPAGSTAAGGTASAPAPTTTTRPEPAPAPSPAPPPTSDPIPRPPANPAPSPEVPLVPPAPVPIPAPPAILQPLDDAAAAVGDVIRGVVGLVGSTLP